LVAGSTAEGRAPRVAEKKASQWHIKNGQGEILAHFHVKEGTCKVTFCYSQNTIQADAQCASAFS
jgi:hypothetical protein